MRFNKFTFLSAVSALALTLFLAGCPGGTTVNVPDECTEEDCPRVVPGGGDGGGAPLPGGDESLSAFVSSERPILIRGDVEEGGAVIQVTSSKDATFVWEVVVEGFPDPTDFMSFCDNNDNSCQEPEGVVDAFVGFLRINRILSDPGATGTRVVISVTATAKDESGESVTEATVLDVVRRETELALSITNPSRVNPGEEILLTALISGGSPFIYNGTGVEINGCGDGSFQQRFDAGDNQSVKFRALPPLDEDGNPELQLPPSQQVPFCISASILESFIEAEEENVAFVPVDGNALFEITNEGQTVVELSYLAPDAQGEVRFELVVIDERGSQVSETVVIDVASADQLLIAQASAASNVAAPGVTVPVDVTATGGETPYSVAVEITGANQIGSLDKEGCSDLNLREVCTVDYTAPADELGTVQLLVTVTDRIGEATEQLIPISVEAPQALALGFTADRAGMQPRDTTGVEASVIGGTPPYDVCFTTDQGILSGFEPSESDTCDPIVISDINYTQCVCGVGSLESRGAELLFVTGDYTAPNMATNATIRAAVRDSIRAENGIATEKIVAGRINMPVSSNESGGNDPISAFLSASPDSFACPGDTVTLTVSGFGGTGDYTFAFIADPNCDACDGGDNDGDPCVTDADCPNGGTCAPECFTPANTDHCGDICAGGDNDGDLCASDVDCPNGGTCVNQPNCTVVFDPSLAATDSTT
ncbi:MAG: hypothetical protein ACYTHJ_22000, partial [Planctomycetota bacterium]